MSTYTYDGPKADKSTVDAGLNRNITASYTMITDDATMNADQASLQFTADQGIGIGDVHPTNAYAFCSSISSTFHQGSVVPKRKFDIEVTYTTTPDSGGVGSMAVAGPAAPQVAGQQQGVPPADRVSAPLSRGWDLSTSGGTRKTSIYADRNGLPFTNSLGDPIFPPMTRDAPTMKAKLSINRATRYDSHYNYQGYVNNDTVSIPGMTRSFNANCLKLMNLNITPVYENGVSYWRHDYDIESGPYWTWNFATYLGWRLQVPNVGKRAKVGDKILPITDSGILVSEPQYLDFSGHRLPQGFLPSAIEWIIRNPDPQFDMTILWT